MLYKDFQGCKLSALGFGAMRLPVLGGDDGAIDQAATEEMVAYAIDHGVNYFDTAWGYHNGTSEAAMGRALSAYPRDSFYLATKFPGYDLSNMDKVEEIFEAQLERTGVEYFDFYLIHNVCELNIDEYLNPAHGIMPYLLKQKAAGRIRHLGFSAHGAIPVMERFLEAYGEHMEFCQIQLNYLDWEFQDAKSKVALCRAHGLPVWVMEPVRGGKLANLSPEDAEKLAAQRPDETSVAWAFRFVQSVPEVCVTLSGMSNFEQLKQNIATFEEERPLTDADRAALDEIVAGMLSQGTVPCTACHYCTSHCPMGLDIPDLLALYNQRKLTGNGDFISRMRLQIMDEDKRPSACIGCGSCAAVCPQQIDIPSVLAEFAAATAH